MKKEAKPKNLKKILKELNDLKSKVAKNTMEIHQWEIHYDNLQDLWQNHYKDMIDLGYYRIAKNEDLEYIVCLIDVKDIYYRDGLVFYVKENLDNGSKVGHIVNELEKNKSCKCFKIPFSNYMENPIPIYSVDYLWEHYGLKMGKLQDLGFLRHRV